MPLPTPSKNQSRQEFLDVCMSNSEMRKEFPDQDQRFAVCQQKWEDKASQASMTIQKGKQTTYVYDPEVSEND